MTTKVYKYGALPPGQESAIRQQMKLARELRMPAQWLVNYDKETSMIDVRMILEKEDETFFRRGNVLRIIVSNGTESYERREHFSDDCLKSDLRHLLEYCTTIVLREVREGIRSRENTADG